MYFCKIVIYKECMFKTKPFHCSLHLLQIEAVIIITITFVQPSSFLKHSLRLLHKISSYFVTDLICKFMYF